MEIFSRIQATENSRQYLLLRADILQTSGAPACLPRSMLMHLKSIIMLSRRGMGGRQGMGWGFDVSLSVSVHYLFYQDQNMDSSFSRQRRPLCGEGIVRLANSVSV